ncbi:MAG TPA: hypothetical protein VGN63_16830 [Flavisolibacter sp.]|jgi:hypothetical protein|nr:hypothetical protein [Flavisolibacter sp.]
MTYHQPDTRWHHFSINDFDAYVTALVVKGRFHPCVPEDVTEAYNIAEHMMAHAWYHYPLYHEALSKVLRIIEMAVKLRCRQLQIALSRKVTKKGRETEEKRPLKQLMDDLVKAEPEKALASQFEVARSLRNLLMHPDSHTYSGAMSIRFIMQSVTLLNTLFLPPALVAGLQQHLDTVKKQIECFHIRQLVLDEGNGRVLLEDVSIEAAICIGNQWQYLLACHPLINNAAENLQKGSYPKPICYFVADLSVTEDKIEAQILDANQSLSIVHTDHPTNIDTYNSWLQAKEVLPENDRLLLKHYTSHEVGECENEFWYTKLYKVTANVVE